MSKEKADLAYFKGDMDNDKLKFISVVTNAISVNENRNHNLPKTRLTNLVKECMKRDANWFNKHKMIMLSYTDNEKDEVVEAIVGLVEKHCDPSLYISCRKSPNGKSIAFTGPCADELFAKSSIAEDKKFILKLGNDKVNYYTLSYPLRKKLKCFGGIRLKDVIQNGKSS